MSSLEEKIAARSGRIQLVMGAMTTLAQAIHLEEDPDSEAFDCAVNRLAELAAEFDVRWCDETADLLKEMYNRRRGP